MKSKVYSNLLWRFLERCGAQAVTLIVSIVLARILDPSVYGTISLITVFIVILQVFIDCGLGTALIQKKDSDQIDFSTVFFANIVICSLLYLVLFFCAPLIALFYKNSLLTPIIRVMGLTLIISAFKNIQQAYVAKNMIFRKFFFATLIGTIAAAVVGILMAYKGFGVWALVIQNLVNQTVDTIILFIIVKWKPSFSFSFKRFKKLASYSWKILVTGLIDVFYEKMRQLAIGKVYSKEDLAYYNEGQQIPYTIISNLNTSIDSVLFPTVSKEQDSLTRVKEMTRKSIKVSTYVITPMLIGLAAISEPLVRFLLTEKWLPCIFYFVLSCFVFIITPIATAHLNAIKALGKSGKLLFIEIIKKAIGVLLLAITLRMGVKAIAIGFFASIAIGQLINSIWSSKYLKYTFIEQFDDFVPNLLISLIMGLFVYRIQFYGLTDWLTIAIQIICGIVIYLSLSKITNNDNLRTIIGIIKNYVPINRKDKNND